MDTRIRSIAAEYSARRKREDCASTRAAVVDLLSKYRLQIRVRGLVDAAADAVGSWTAFDADNLDVSALTPDLREAFTAAFPNMNLGDLEDMAPSAIGGLATAWRGKLFEVIVARRLNAGEWVGGLHLETGQAAALAELANQPGWDIAITDAHGAVAEELSIKATDSVAYLREALDRYPDIRVLTTEDTGELLDHLSDRVMIDQDMSVAELMERVDSPLAELQDSPLEEFIEDVAPYLVFALIIGQEALALAKGRKTASDALGSGARRAAKSLVSRGAGAAASLISPTLAAPASFMTRLGMERARGARDAATVTEEWRSRVSGLGSSPNPTVGFSAAGRAAPNRLDQPRLTGRETVYGFSNLLSGRRQNSVGRRAHSGARR